MERYPAIIFRHGFTRAQWDQLTPDEKVKFLNDFLAMEGQPPAYYSWVDTYPKNPTYRGKVMRASGDLAYDYISGNASAADLAAAAADPDKSVQVAGILKKANIALGAGVAAGVVGMVLGYMSVKRMR